VCVCVCLVEIGERERDRNRCIHVLGRESGGRDRDREGARRWRVGFPPIFLVFHFILFY
jgi:hypothetical protein